MRNTHLFEQFMQENRIEYDVPFKIVFKPTIGETDFDTVYIHKDDNRLIGFTLNYADTDEEVEGDRFDILDVLFSDRMEIVKKPWKPEDGEKYWYVWFDKIRNYNVSSSNWEKHSADFNRYIIGNCFKTEEEAHEHIYDIIQVLQHGAPFVKWEE